MICNNCGGPAKPLFLGKYCVNECDLLPDEKTPVEYRLRPGPTIVLADYKCIVCDKVWAADVDKVSAGLTCPCGGTLVIQQGT